MAKAKCPGCATLLEFDPTAESITCTSCRRTIRLKAKSATKAVEIEESIPLQMEPIEESPERPRKRKRPKPKKGKSQAKPLARSRRRMFIGLGAVAGLAVIGLALYLLWPTGAQRSTLAENLRPPRTLNTYEEIPWAVPSGALAESVKPVDSSVKSSLGIIAEGPDGLYVSAKWEASNPNANVADRQQGLAYVVSVGKLDATGKSGTVIRKLTGDFAPVQDKRRGSESPADVRAFFLERGHVAIYRPDQSSKIRMIEIATGAEKTIDAMAGAKHLPNRSPVDVVMAAGPVLVSLASGSLNGWDAKTGAKRYTLESGYDSHFAIAPNGQWVVLSVRQQYLEVVSLQEGRVLARFGGEGGWSRVDLAPDASRILATRPMVASELQTGMIEFHHWSPKDGSHAAPIRVDDVGSSPWQWLGPNRLVITGPNHTHGVLKNHLLDLNAGQEFAQIHWPNLHQSRSVRAVGEALHYLPRSGNGTVTLPLELSAAFPTLEPLAFTRGATVSVEAKLGDTARNKAAVQIFSDILTEEGFKIGSGGWKYLIEGEEIEYESKISDVAKDERIKLRRVTGSVTLLDPGGQPIHKVVHEGLNVSLQQYSDRGTTTGVGIGAITVTNYDFRGKDPGEITAKESWEHFLKALDTLSFARGCLPGSPPTPLPVILTPTAKVLGGE